MSLEHIENFLEALKTDTTMLEEFQDTIGGLQSVVDFAASKGFSISLEDAREFLRTQADIELSDEQLEAIAGGKGHSSSSSVAVATQAAAVQTVAAATTEAAVSETTEAVIAETTEAAAVETSLVAAVEAVVVPVLVS
ncbi:Uncharacterised protein [BD1-7 clade bacterium]|uniref:Nif11 domain-containing protein n=1 Tax=BD1-7 clade bacterium TaxID=2029982 RepID=A0A5S9P413_9GAMM|nr:Uncharacterised protein [BD1-7 clade bacterium]CAA0098241.1 Uncharacterised protein [BD1-7 clade bacterium]